MRRLFVTIIGAVLATAVISAQTPDAAKVAAGQKAYAAKKCDTCHAIGGKGGKLSTALDGIGGKLSEADVRMWLTKPAEMEKKLTTKPKMLMSTWAKTNKLTDADVDAITAYMMSLK